MEECNKLHLVYNELVLGGLIRLSLIGWVIWLPADGTGVFFSVTDWSFPTIADLF